MDWVLRYSIHVGYAPPQRLLLFRASAGSDRAEHVRFAARMGFAGVLFPWAAESPAEERHRVRAALAETGLQCGSIVFTPVMDPVWVVEGRDAQDRMLGHLADALAIAKEFGSDNLAVLIRGDGHTALAVQRRRAIDQLRVAADVAAANGMVLAIEPMVSFPDMLLRNFSESVELVRAAAHPAIKLIFDTGHLTRMGDPLLSTYVEAYDDIHVLQLADMPGRVEIGAGEIDFVPLLAHAMSRGYRGLVDLEHDWLEPGEAAERRAIDKLSAIDALARRRAFGA
ncbi:MAG TPA: sugar phosphate isomerase/epimerase family protein [Steroidobacteraceae bacterium]|nr:sugar phosphate isomerase/epimerase family protein [Steroidobacteraceae bacterium]